MTDTVEGGSSRPPWRPSHRARALIAAVVVAGGGAGLAVVLGNHSDGSRPVRTPSPSGRPPTLQCSTDGPRQHDPRRTVAVALPASGSALERRDPTARQGPRTTIARGDSGLLGADEATVTFPVPQPRHGQRVDVGGHPGRIDLPFLTWSVGGRWARIRWNRTGLPIALAAHTRIRHRRAVLPPAAGLSHTVTVPARAAVTREIRYDGGELGLPGRVLGGQVFTGVVRSAVLDEWLLHTAASQSGTIAGGPLYVTTVFGGNGAVAWEVRPGTVAYVGYSGAELSPRTQQALTCLAVEHRALVRTDWHALHPQVMSGS